LQRLGRVLKVVAINLVIFVVALEIGLRVAPAVIPEGLLKRFEPSLRASIAERRSLPNVSDVVQVDRDDNGPPLLIFKPGVVVQFVSRETGGTGEIHMDDRGFCNPEGTVPASGSVDIVAMGDSFTACMNEPPDSSAPESYVNWPFVLGRMAGVSVYNLSRGGYGVYEYVQLLKHYGLQLQPKIAIMQIYEGNDLRDAQHNVAFQQMSPEERANVPLRASWEPLKVSYEGLLRNWIGRTSYAYNFLLVAAVKGISAVIDMTERSTGAEAAVNFKFWLEYEPSPILMNPDNDQKDEVRTARSLRAGEFSLDNFDAPLEEFAELARENGFTAVLSYAPAAHVAYESVVRFEDPELKELMLWYSQEQRAYFARKCEELGIVFIDLTPVLVAGIEKHGADALLYYPSNIHFTVLGHQVVSQELLRVLNERQLLPSN
jgi:hypothetical protein